MQLSSLLNFLRSRAKALHAAAALAVLFPIKTFAALPSEQAPTRGEGSTLTQTIQNYVYDAFMLIGLILCAGGLVLVARHALGVYHEIHNGKAKWADLGATSAVGAVLIGVTIYVVTQATGIL